MQKIDDTIRSILEQQYSLARELLETHRDTVELMAKTLLDKETIGAKEIESIMNSKTDNTPNA